MDENYFNPIKMLQEAYARGDGRLKSLHSKHFNVDFQEGTVNNPNDINGVLVEDLLIASACRLKYYNEQVPDCNTSLAITKIEEALSHLYMRQQDRRARGVEGTMKG